MSIATRTHGFSIAIIAVLAAAAAPASAYVRATTEAGTPLAWQRTCPGFTLDLHFPPELAADIRASLDEARTAWQDGDGCASPPVLIGGDGPAAIEFDRRNTILWRPADFCADGMGHDEEEICLSPNAAAITHTFFFEDGDHAGELIEADIEVNGKIDFATDGRDEAIDLTAAFSHELGHVYGLDHSCNPIPGRAAPLDHRGEPIPGCYPTGSAPADVRATTMFAVLFPGDLEPRTPTEEERGAVCAIHAAHDGSCDPIPAGCGCGAAADGAPIALAACAFVLAGRHRRATRGRKRGLHDRAATPRNGA